LLIVSPFVGVAIDHAVLFRNTRIPFAHTRVNALLNPAGEPFPALRDLADELGLGANHLASRSYFVAKRTLDMVVATVLLIALVWVFALIAILVKMSSPGPVFFRQVRIGRHGQPFTMIKLRTMCPERRRRNAGPPDGVPDRRRRHKSRRDPRVTHIGRLLRRSCLDELPQLWNVLRGEMSLVGPRPELPEIVARYEAWQHARHLVTPGITGWWQVNRDRQRLMHEATELDLHYVRNQSLWLDLLILARTLGSVVRGSGAF
jgi:lipopolysaccharide/colanic/teichoic acid biosynthesis glycosyltransferase